jgi:hypothetical protein
MANLREDFLVKTESEVRHTVFAALKGLQRDPVQGFTF